MMDEPLCLQPVVFCFLGVGILICLYHLARVGLVVIGQRKSPVLASFERYSEHEAIYHPLLQFLGWLGMLVVGVWLVSGLLEGSLLAVFFVIVLTLPVGWLWYQFAYRVRPLLDRHFLFPLWYRDLYWRTSRYERRRIAYMWLRLPPSTRALLDADTHAFMGWTDLVIMGAVLEEDPNERRVATPADNAVLRHYLRRDDPDEI